MICATAGIRDAVATDLREPLAATNVFAAAFIDGYHRLTDIAARPKFPVQAWESVTNVASARRGPQNVAAVVIEPVTGASGAAIAPPPGYMAELRRICDRHDVLLVFDEIATGFGRTGELFAADHAPVAPDVMCVGKALTGGYLTMGATLCTSAVARGISDGEAGVLMHGPTFMANPLAAAVAGASVELLLRRDWRAEVRGIEKALRAGLAPARSLPGVVDVRVLGGIGVVQLDGPVDVAAATAAAVDAGVWLRPFRDLVYTMPPYVCTPDDLTTITAAVCAAAAAGR